MTNEQEKFVFASLARDCPKFKEWLQEELERQYQFLAHQVPEAGLRNAQGKAQLLLELLKRIDSSRG